MNEREERRLKQLRREFFRRAIPHFKKHQPLPPSVARIAADYVLTFLLTHDPIECAATAIGVRASELRRWIRVGLASGDVYRRRAVRARGAVVNSVRTRGRTRRRAP